jgi:thioesterase domain-containing protein/acyl carrier protein
VETVREQEITVLQVVPTLLRGLLEEELSSCRSLRRLCVGGEALTSDLRAGFFATGLTAELINLYGPTEVTIDSLWSRCLAEEEGAAVPIGRPIAHTRVWLLDARGEPVPVGVPGHLHLGGAGVGRGYRGRPDLTAASYVPDPFGPDGSRLYRTGDLARWLPDGNLESLGRIDHQVKLRGFRIELGEIEAVLAEHPAVRQVAVVAREEAPGDRRLVAYWVPEGAGTTPADLRAYLKERLPEYMVPAVFVEFAILPLNPNGKVDRRALPVPAPHHVTAGAAPRDSVELELARIWEDLLGVRSPGINDNFFELGGHSLLAVRLVRRLAAVFGVEIPLASLFTAGTLEGLASLVRSRGGAIPASPMVAIRPEGSRRPWFWIHPAGGGVLCYWSLARHLASDRPLYGLQARGLDGRQEPLRDVPAMAQAYVGEVRRVQPEGPYLLGGWSMGGVVAFEMARQLVAEGSEVELLVLVDSLAPDDRRQLRPEEPREVLGSFALHLGFPAALLPDLYRRGSALGDGELLPGLLAEAQDLGLVPRDLDLPQIQALFEVFRANVRAVQCYRPQPYPSSLMLVRASQDLGGATDGGWGRLATGGVDLRVVEGDHFSMMTEPFVQGLADTISSSLHPVED